MKQILIIIFLITIKGQLVSATLNKIKFNNVEIPIIYEQTDTLPIFNMQLIFQNSGYINDTKSINGLSKLSAKLLNEGTKELGATGFAQKCEQKAISIGASCGLETFVIEASSLQEYSKDAIALLISLLNSPNFDEDTLSKIKTIQKGYIASKQNDYDYQAKRTLSTILYKNTPVAKPSVGTKESIESITINDIKSYLAKHLVLRNLVIVAGGKLSYEEFEDMIDEVLEELFVGEESELTQFSANSDKKQNKIIKDDSEQSYIYFGAPYNIQANDENNYKAKVASFILGAGGFGSRFMEEIRVKRGLAYSAYCTISINKSYSGFSGYLQTKPQNEKEAVELVTSLTDDFIKNGVTKDELEKAKKFILGSEPLRNETLSQRLNRSFMNYYKGFELDFHKKELENIKNLTLDELNKFIKSHKEMQDLSFSIISNK
jgi:predicted Zn-dependent peptidase